MTELDRRTREAAVPPEEPSLWAQVAEMFRGPLRWVSALVAVGGLAFLVLAIVSIVEFFQSGSTREQIAWAGGFGLGLIAVSFSRLWFWLLFHRNAVVREVRRVELQVARLGSLPKPPG